MKKIAVYAIAKNESANVIRWLESVHEADGIFVLDTGSTDDTVELLQEAGVTVKRWSVDKEFRFDNARNASLDLIPLDYDLCLCLDFDEVLVSGWRKPLDDFEGEAANYTLIFSFDSDGNVTCSYPRFAVHKRRGFLWKYPAHEVLVGLKNQKVENLPITVIHLPEKQKPAGHYLPLLRKGYEEHPNDPRCVQYLARELMYCGQYGQAISLFEHHANIEIHPQFKSESFRYIASMHTHLDQLGESEAAYFKAIAAFPEAREAFCELAFLYFLTGEYEAAIGQIRTALRVVEKPDVPMVFKDEYYSHWPYHLLATCYLRLNNQESGIQNLLLAVRQCSGRIPENLIDDLKRCGLDVHFTIQGSDAEEAEPEGISKAIPSGADEVSTGIS